MIFKKDNFSFGLILGLIAPVIGFLIYKFFKFRMFSVGEMLRFMKGNPSLITTFISIGLLANAIIFTFYVNTRRDKTAKGIFILTLIWASVALGFKFW